MDIAAPRRDASDHAAIRGVLTVDVAPTRGLARVGLRRRDLEVPRDTDIDGSFWEVMSEVMDDDEMATHTYGAFVDAALEARQVYADGSCIGQGTHNGPARAGAGLFWGLGSQFNISYRVPGDQTNNRAELFAILAVLVTTPPSVPLEIYTDSQYAINTIVHLGPVLFQTGWNCTNGDVLAAIQYRIRLRRGRIVFHHVYGHGNNKANLAADRLARKGARMDLDEETALEWLVVPSPLPPLEDREVRGQCRVSSTLPSPKRRDKERQRRLSGKGRAGRRGAKRWFLESLREAGTNVVELWRIVNRIRSPPTAARPQVPLEEQTKAYQVRLNPPEDPAAAGFDVDELQRVTDAADSIPLPSLPSRFAVLNELLTAGDIERVKSYLHEKGAGSTPGIDHMTYAALMNIDNAKLVEFLNECLRTGRAPGAFLNTIISSVPKPGKDPTSADGYRGIGLQSCAYKMLSIAYNFKLGAVLETEHILPPTQNGFRPGYRTNNNPFILRTMIDKSRATGKQLMHSVLHTNSWAFL
uniref:ribonuclease H n=1 Tax=Mycena chlorophos TaxID=658473 RepID=A0ABQ0L0E3_MYCCL|nr:predicted protein [Mycena chlorophos]